MEQLSKDGGQTVVLNKLSISTGPTDAKSDLGADAKSALGGGTFLRAVVLDVETTGLEAYDATVIEIAVRPFDFDPFASEVMHIYDSYTALQEPPEPLSDKIKQITGLSDEMLKGQRIDWAVVFSMLLQADIVVAHNANFDRKHVEMAVQRWDYAAAQQKRWTNKVWACTMEGINWDELRSPSRSLSVLCWLHGFFFPPHRACNDVDATTVLLQKSRKAGELYVRSQLPSFEVWAVKAAISTKDILRERGYKWRGEQKCWVLTVPSAQAAEAELPWLQDMVYGKADSKAEIIRIENWQRFK